MLCKRTARRTHKAKIRPVRPAHIVIAVVGVGVDAITYLLPRRNEPIQAIIIIAYRYIIVKVLDFVKVAVAIVGIGIFCNTLLGFTLSVEKKLGTMAIVEIDSLDCKTYCISLSNNLLSIDDKHCFVL